MNPPTAPRASPILADPHAAQASKPIGHAKAVAAITIGNGLEFFDFTIYSFFATIIGKLFFPVEGQLAQLMLAAGTFGVGFIMRPVGGIVLGGYADRAGRKAAMSVTLWLMTIGSAIIALSPTYEMIGIAAPMLIVLARLIQGFALGGEIGASTSLLMEYSSDKTRGFYGSWQFVSQGLSAVCGSLLGVALAAGLSPASLESWGWRVPFLIGMLMGPVAVYIRRHLEETLHVHGESPDSLDRQESAAAVAQPARDIFRRHRGVIAA